MFPIRDENPHPIGFKPTITYLLIILNAIVFLYEILMTGQLFEFNNTEALQLFYTFGTVPDCVLGSDSVTLDTNYNEIMIKCHDLSLITLFTSIFFHGGLIHLGGNMLFLWIFGDNIELKFGKVKYVIIYLSWGIFAGLSHILGDPSSILPAIGASGAISGILGAYLVIFPKAKIMTFMMWGFFWRTMHIQAKWFLPFWLLFQNIIPLFVGGFGVANNGVAYLAHIGGFLIGLLTGYIFIKTNTSDSISKY